MGIPNPELDESSARRPRKSGGAIAEFELSDYMKANVATNKSSYSRHVRVASAPPTAPTGKIPKREITLAGAATRGL